MGDNQLIIEIGAPDFGKGVEAAMELLGTLRGMADSWKAEAIVEDVHQYMMVTGNRTDRAIVFVIEMSHDQLESFVNSNAWMGFMMTAQAHCPNFTTNRSVSLSRVFAAQDG